MHGIAGKEYIMDTHTLTLTAQAGSCSYLLRFTSRYTPGLGIEVPCDRAGLVDIDSLTERLRTAYFVARAMIGREYGYPTVQLVH